MQNPTIQDVEYCPRYKIGYCFVQFVPIEDVPGYTHKVLILHLSACDAQVDGQGVVAKYWLKDTHNPSKRTALFYFRKYLEE